MIEQNLRTTVFGRRKSHRLSHRQKRLIEELLPKLSVPSPQGSTFGKRIAKSSKDYNGVWLEVGFGKGEQLAELAAEHPDALFIGCEPYINGVASLLGKIDDRGLTNILIHQGDAIEVIDRLPDAFLDHILIIHPDPWPKRRHWKRRFINAASTPKLSRVIRDGGELFIVSDDASYLSWILMHLARESGFDWTAESASDWQSRPSGWPETRYARKASAEGRSSINLRFCRRARTPHA